VPIYEYKCAHCGEVFEAFQKITDEPLTNCKFCNSSVEKLISHSSFQLKGSGWYLTDYAKKSSSPVAEKPKAAETAEKSETSASSTETKSTEAKSESKT
jgi:putative FmdB family regulatory protein